MAQIGRNQISFTKFLGSGAFGEVYEGSVIDLHNSDDTRVAIKVCINFFASMRLELSITDVDL